MPETVTASNIAAGALPKSAGLLRRLAAISYDALLLTALLMVVTWLLLPLTGGRAIAAESPRWWLLAYRLLLLTVLIGYFGFCWTRSGQTLGMQAWNIRVMRHDGGPLRWRDVPLRLAGALLSTLALGLGYVWLLVDRERLTWHDRLSLTRVVKTQRPPS